MVSYAVMLEIAFPLSMSLLASFKGLERIMMTTFWFLKIIISMLNFIACVAVNEITISLCHSIKFDYDFLIMKWIPNYCYSEIFTLCEELV